MGEWSKKIGEYGEDIVEKFLSLIGWHDLVKGISLQCMNSEKHLNENGKPVLSHGIDFLYSYMNPLVNGQLTSIIVSSKYKTTKYPNSPTVLFKEFMNELISTLECFSNSNLKSEITSGYNCSTFSDVGVLFWLNSDRDSNDDLISVIASARFLDSSLNKTIYIIDNKRICFILEVMKYLKTMDAKFDYSFYYPNTGQNINPLIRENVGKILPVEYINSTLIPVKLSNKYNPKETCLFVATLDPFDEEDLIRLIGWSKDITTDLIGEVIIAFPDYQELNHRDIVNITKQKFQSSEFTKTVSVVNFNNPLNVF